MPRMCPACLPGRALHVRVLASLKTALAGEEAGLRKNSLRSPCAQGPPLKMDRAGGKRRVKKKTSPMSQATTCPNPARGAGRRQLRPQSPRISRRSSGLSWMCPRRPFCFPRLAHSAVGLSPPFRPALSSPSPPNPCVLSSCGASASPCPCVGVVALLTLLATTVQRAPGLVHSGVEAARSSVQQPACAARPGSSDHEHPCP